MKNVEFPFIENFDDVKAVANESDFLIKIDEDNGYICVTYKGIDSRIFGDGTKSEDFIARELRGIIFDLETGNILRRPLHKFFNYGEKLEFSEAEIDFDKPHYIMEKLDGSMVVPFRTSKKDSIIWGSKAGKTFIHDLVSQFLQHNSNYEDLFYECEVLGLSPIFEFCTRKNTIVIDYPEDKLVLTAIRDKLTGKYSDYDELVLFGTKHNIPVVSVVGGDEFTHTYTQTVRESSGDEGVVVAFEDGQRIKVKSEWYCTIHRAKESVEREHDVVSLSLNKQLDDLKPLLRMEDVKTLENFEFKLYTSVEGIVNTVMDDVMTVMDRKMSKKDYALSLFKESPPIVGHIIFSLFDEIQKEDFLVDYGMIYDMVLNSFLKYTNTLSRWKDFKELNGFVDLEYDTIGKLSRTESGSENFN